MRDCGQERDKAIACTVPERHLWNDAGKLAMLLQVLQESDRDWIRIQST
jgi:hypothetical protein